MFKRLVPIRRKTQRFLFLNSTLRSREKAISDFKKAEIENFCILYTSIGAKVLPETSDSTFAIGGFRQHISLLPETFGSTEMCYRKQCYRRVLSDNSRNTYFCQNLPIFFAWLFKHKVLLPRQVFPNWHHQLSVGDDLSVPTILNPKYALENSL